MAHDFALIPASYVYLRRDDEVLLQRRHNSGYMDGHWVAGAAGHIERGETARQAAVREAAEELGVAIDPNALRLLTVLQRTDGTNAAIEQRVEWFWAADEWADEPRIMEPAKASSLAWFSLDELPAPVSPYELVILQGMRDGTLGADSSYGFDSPSVPSGTQSPGRRNSP